MTLLSKLRPLIKSLTFAEKTALQRQMSDHRTMPLQPSRWQWTKFKDLIHFYVAIGLIPCSLFVGYLNLFTGPATLSEIPKDYEPQYWEYYKSPVTRFLARYVFTNPQQNYEKYCCHLFMEHERIRLRELEDSIKQKLAERNDYQAYYYKPVATKYYRILKEGSDQIINLDDPVGRD